LEGLQCHRNCFNKVSFIKVRKVYVDIGTALTRSVLLKFGRFILQVRDLIILAVSLDLVKAVPMSM
jgi:hypothetical protein